MKLIKGIFDLILAGFILILVLLTIPKLWGYEIYTVTSGSMEPEIGAGDVVYVKAEEEQKLNTGDIITFTLNQGETRVTHRIIEIDEKNKLIRTKGDANNLADASWVSLNNVLGVVRYSIKGLGYVAMLTSTISGKLFVLAVFLWITAAEMVLDHIKAQNSRREMRIN